MKRSWRAVVFVLVFALVGAACSGGKDNGNKGDTGGKVQLTMWMGYTPPPPANQSQEYLSIQRMVKEFEGQNPNITIDYLREQRQRAAEADGRAAGGQAARRHLSVRHEHAAARRDARRSST